MSSPLKHIEKIVPDAYHGTSKTNARRIQNSGFRISDGSHQYLGSGVYFFEGSMLSALQWAKRSFPSIECTVLHAIVNLGICLDFHNPEHADFIVEMKEAIVTRQKTLPADDPNRFSPITDAVVINGLADLVQIDTVRASYVSIKSGRKIFPGSHFFNPQQLIICVRNLDRILGLKII
jgi:hypothetical protein